MSRPESEHPTQLELEILKILWRDSPLPVREVRAQLKETDRPLAHSSVITILNIMHRKGYVSRKKSGNAFLFSPKVKEGNVTGQMTADLLSRAFGGSPAAMMLKLLETDDIDAEELAQLRKLINQKAKELKQ